MFGMTWGQLRQLLLRPYWMWRYGRAVRRLAEAAAWKRTLTDSFSSAADPAEAIGVADLHMILASCDAAWAARRAWGSAHAD